VTGVKRLLAIAAALALVFAFVVPAYANVHTVDPDKRSSDTDISFTFDLPIELQVKHACWAELKGWYGDDTQKESFNLGSISPGDSAFDRARLVVKSNDDFSKSFSWTNLAWVPEDNKGPYPDLIPVVSIDGQTRTSPFALTSVSPGESYDPISIGFANVPWTAHSGSYVGTITISISQE
jgi:hypothetical protein